MERRSETPGGTNIKNKLNSFSIFASKDVCMN